MRFNYDTVKGYAEQEIVITKSRFIAYVNRAETEEHAQKFLAQVRSQHPQASHHCMAYLIGENNDSQKASDDGEPNGTAGKPMLEVLKKKKLQDTVVIVVRYFGGTKLGAGGLIRAYGKATSEGIQAAGIVSRILHRKITAYIDYTWHGKVEHALRNENYRISDTDYTEKVGLSILVPVDQESMFSEWITNLTQGQLTLTPGSSQYVESVYEPKLG